MAQSLLNGITLLVEIEEESRSLTTDKQCACTRDFNPVHGNMI